jgi:hypothetical protein
MRRRSRQFDFDQLATQADRIFVGTVTAANPTMTVRGAIVTDFVFGEVEDVRVPRPAPTQSVRMIGRTLGTRTLSVPGAPTFRIGERYLVFVSATDACMFPTLGGPQGIYRMRVDSQKSRTEVLDYAGNPVTSLPSRGTAGPAQAGNRDHELRRLRRSPSPRKPSSRRSASASRPHDEAPGSRARRRRVLRVGCRCPAMPSRSCRCTRARRCG